MTQPEGAGRKLAFQLMGGGGSRRKRGPKGLGGKKHCLIKPQFPLRPLCYDFTDLIKLYLAINYARSSN